MEGFVELVQRSFVDIDAPVLVRFLCCYGATSPASASLVKTKSVPGSMARLCIQLRTCVARTFSLVDPGLSRHNDGDHIFSTHTHTHTLVLLLFPLRRLISRKFKFGSQRVLALCWHCSGCLWGGFCFPELWSCWIVSVLVADPIKGSSGAPRQLEFLSIEHRRSFLRSTMQGNARETLSVPNVTR